MFLKIDQPSKKSMIMLSQSNLALFSQITPSPFNMELLKLLLLIAFFGQLIVGSPRMIIGVGDASGAVTDLWEALSGSGDRQNNQQQQQPQQKRKRLFETFSRTVAKSNNK